MLNLVTKLIFSAVFVLLTLFILSSWTFKVGGESMQRSSSPVVELYNGGQTTPSPTTAATGTGPGPFSAGRLSTSSASSPMSSASTSFAERAQSPTRLTADAKRHKYLRRILKFRQMDFEYAFWQMLYLLIAPQKVYVYIAAYFIFGMHECANHRTIIAVLKVTGQLADLPTTGLVRSRTSQLEDTATNSACSWKYFENQ